MATKEKPKRLEVLGGYPFPTIRVEAGLDPPERLPFTTGDLVLSGSSHYEWVPHK